MILQRFIIICSLLRSLALALLHMIRLLSDNFNLRFSFKIHSIIVSHKHNVLQLSLLVTKKIVGPWFDCLLPSRPFAFIRDRQICVWTKMSGRDEREIKSGRAREKNKCYIVLHVINSLGLSLAKTPSLCRLNCSSANSEGLLNETISFFPWLLKCWILFSLFRRLLKKAHCIIANLMLFVFVLLFTRLSVFFSPALPHLVKMPLPLCFIFIFLSFVVFFCQIYK